MDKLFTLTSIKPQKDIYFSSLMGGKRLYNYHVLFCRMNAKRRFAVLRGAFLVMFLVCSWAGTQAMEGSSGGDSFKPFRMTTGNRLPDVVLPEPVEAFVQIIRQCYSPNADYSCGRVASIRNSPEISYEDYYIWTKGNTSLFVKISFESLFKEFYALAKDPTCTNKQISFYVEQHQLELEFNPSADITQPYITVKNNSEAIILLFLKSNVVSLAHK